MGKKDKIRVSVRLPADFLQFLRDVASAIERRVRSAIVESDDLLQCTFAYGGLYDAEKMRFGFTYFPIGDENVTWVFDFSVDDILDIAAGRKMDVGSWRCQDSGCEMRHGSKDAYCPQCDNILDHIDEEVRFRRLYAVASDDDIRRLVKVRRITHAVLGYHKLNGHFPPPWTRDEHGRKLHSWRTLILPHLDESLLYRRVDFSKAWDADENRWLWKSMPQIFRTSPESETDTEFVAVVGESTIWPNFGKRSCADIQTGSSYTIAVVARPSFPQCWMAPADVHLEQFLRHFETEHHSLIAGFCDGNAKLLTDPRKDELKKLFRT